MKDNLMLDYMKRPSDVCIFCGSNEKLTKEHIFGKWLKNHPNVNIADKTFHQTSFTNIGSKTGKENPSVAKGKLHRNGPPHAQQLRIVCKTCNNGWMSRLQDNAKPILLELHDGNWPTLNEDALYKVSNWAIMATMCLEFADVNSIATSKEERAFFKENEKPPSNWQVYAGLCKDEGYTGDFFHRGMSVNDCNINSQITTFRYGKCVFHTLSAADKHLPDPEVYASDLYIKQFYPFPNSIPTYPIIHDGEGLTMISIFFSLLFLPKPLDTFIPSNLKHILN